jgi:uncharacterized protein YraI
MSRYLKASLLVLIIGMLTTPASAQEEPNGYPITDVNLRAGPGTEYPVLVTVPTEAPITILGCLEDYTWCDTAFEDYRGWMRSIYLTGYYDGEYYLLSDYAPDLGYQIVTFDIAAYWDSYYQDEPFYNDQYRVSEARGEGWVDDDVFYDRLSPYGSWTWTQGQYVWVPTGVNASWRPYTRGRWIYTDYGWTWASYEPFGWATYHYGRWGFSSRIGWFWVPGNRWGPAWVYWRQSDDYLAWAPLPPVYDRGGLGINISIGAIPAYYWSVVPSLYFLSGDLPRYYVHDRHRWRRAYNRTRPIGHTTFINKTVVNRVVNVNYVERHTNKKVVERKIRRTREWGRAGKVHDDAYEVYRPRLREGRGRHAPDRPRNIEEVAKLSKTRDLARGEATTEDLLAPPEVREAMKKRKAGRIRGAQPEAGEFTRDEGGARKFDRRLPKGRDAEGPPPSIKKARTEPVPAHDLGRLRGGPDGRPGRERRPEKSISVPDTEKGPPSAETRGPKAEPPDGKERRRVEPRAKSTVDEDVKGGPKESQRARKASPNGKPGQGLAGQGPSDRKPDTKKARSKEGVKPGDQRERPHARSREKGPLELQGSSDRKPALKKRLLKEKAKSRDQNEAPQARSRQQGSSGGSPEKKVKSKDQKSPAAAKKAKPEAKARPSAQKAKRKPQAKQQRAKPRAAAKTRAAGKANKKKKKKKEGLRP